MFVSVYISVFVVKINKIKFKFCVSVKLWVVIIFWIFLLFNSSVKL